MQLPPATHFVKLLFEKFCSLTIKKMSFQQISFSCIYDNDLFCVSN